MSEESEDKLDFIKKFTRLDSVDAAEKEASEVLHSLLSVERIEKHHDHEQQHMQQVVVLNCTQPSHEHNTSDDVSDMQWHTRVHQRLFSLDHNDSFLQQNNTVVWEGTLAVEDNNHINQDQTMILGNDNQNDGYESIEVSSPSVNRKLNEGQTTKVTKKAVRKRYKKAIKPLPKQDECKNGDDNIENDTHDVRARFQLGCECQDDSCFRALNPENVYKHRLNIAELTKEEHDMYLMGVTMACISDPGITAKQRERRRLRAQYVYQGRRVCLSAFLYLENCTLYQIKRIRKHVTTHGVTPRVHGNHKKKPHNVFSLETYRRATEFLKSYIQLHNTAPGNCKSAVLFPPEVSRKAIHNAYIDFLKDTALPEGKIMGYSTFRHFMKEQFPHLRFCKTELGIPTKLDLLNSASNSSSAKQQSQQQQQQTNQSIQTNQPEEKSTIMLQTQHSGMLLQPHIETCQQPSPLQTIISPSQMTTIPVILSESNKPDLNQPQTAYIVTPVSQLMQTPYQTGHTITVTPIANAAYAFTTL